jgi:hypothetical protein
MHTCAVHTFASSIINHHYPRRQRKRGVADSGQSRRPNAGTELL